MYVRGLDLQEISLRLQPYIIKYFTGCELEDFDDGMFAESNLIGVEELKEILPTKYLSLFDNNSLVNLASSEICFIHQGKRFKNRDYTVYMVVDEEYTKVLFLLLHETGEDGREKTIILKNFICSELYDPVK